MPGTHLPVGQPGAGLPSAMRLAGTASVTKDKTSATQRRFFFTVKLSPFQGGITVIMCYLVAERQITGVTVTHPGSVDFMALFSVQQDLRDKSLKAVSGGLNRLQYLADLRDRDSATYSHWGLSRVYGTEAASQALAREHRQLVTTLLSAPLANLLEDLQGCSQAAGLTPAAFLNRLCERKTASLLPPDSGAGSELHLSSALAALSALLDSPACATRQA